MLKKKAVIFLLANCVTNTHAHEAPMKIDNLYCIVLAGGNGERLWPLSRTEKPKQLLALGSNETLLEQAINRVRPLTHKKNIFISTTTDHASKIQAVLGDTIGGIIAEPASRNTGPSILLCCMEIHKINPQAIIVFVPADAFIPKPERYIEFLEHAVDFAQDNERITLLGLRPTYPATGYGYIEYQNNFRAGAPFPVRTFREKPSLDVARTYIEAGTMLWNIGLFCGQVSIFIEEFQQLAPEIYANVKAYVDGTGSYEAVPSISVDYAVMEKSNRISVLPVDFVWYDVGNVEVFLSLQEQFNPTNNKVITIESHNNLVDVKDKLVALIGVDDLCIVETNDTLLITKRENAEKVKLVVNQLKSNRNLEYL